jgi:tetratricopeptide (TPR) repeat protein
MIVKRFGFLILSLCLSACAGMFVPATSDPHKKLNWANELFDRQGRPLPAERFLQEALQEFQRQSDQMGLAKAYREYGFFFKSPAVEKWEKHYRTKGFLDKTATYDARMEKAVESFKKSEELFSALNQYDALTNVQLNLGFTYQTRGELDAACQTFDRSLESHQKNLEQNPNAKVQLPSGYATYQEFITSYKQKAGCR